MAIGLALHVARVGQVGQRGRDGGHRAAHVPHDEHPRGPRDPGAHQPPQHMPMVHMPHLVRHHRRHRGVVLHQRHQRVGHHHHAAGERKGVGADGGATELHAHRRAILALQQRGQPLAQPLLLRHRQGTGLQHLPIHRGQGFLPDGGFHGHRGARGHPRGRARHPPQVRPPGQQRRGGQSQQRQRPVALPACHQPVLHPQRLQQPVKLLLATHLQVRPARKAHHPRRRRQPLGQLQVIPRDRDGGRVIAPPEAQLTLVHPQPHRARHRAHAVEVLRRHHRQGRGPGVGGHSPTSRPRSSTTLSPVAPAAVPSWAARKVGDSVLTTSSDSTRVRCSRTAANGA